jgi:hypothetical protein
MGEEEVMSYARMGRESDLYIFLAAGVNKLTCCGCNLLSMDAPLEMDGASFYANSTKEMIEHIDSHRAIGHLVPEGIEENLLNDNATNYPGF